MQLLGAWFEDIHFSSPLSANTSTTYFRSQYARGALQVNGTSGSNKGNATFTPTEDVWLSGTCYTSGAFTNQNRFFGCTYSGLAGYNGIFVGAGPSATSTVSVYKYVSGAATTLQTSAGVLAAGINRIVLRLTGISNLSALRIRVYVGDLVDPVVDWTGDARVAGMSSIDTFQLGSAYVSYYISECMATDEDPRAWGLKTLAVSGAGDANTMNSGTYLDVDEMTANDLDRVIASASGQEIDLAVGNLPAGAYAVAGVVSSMRVTDPDQTVPIAIGVRTGGTTYTDAVTLPPTSWGLMQKIYNTNPDTSAAWTVSEVNNLQLAVKS